MSYEPEQIGVYQLADRQPARPPLHPASPALAGDQYEDKMQSFLACIVESADDSIVGFDLDGKILSWNEGAHKLFGYTREEAIGDLIAMLFLPDQQTHYLKFLEKIREQIRIDRFEAVRVAKGGRAIDVSIISSPVKDRLGRLIGGSAIYRDITRRKVEEAQLREAKEAAEAASRAKSEFLANMSHEIRTPMNGILAMTDLLLDGDLTEKQRIEYLGIVKFSANALVTIISDILDFSRIEARKLCLENQQLRIQPFLEAIVKEMHIHAAKKGLTLLLQVQPETPDMVTGDPNRLRQILVNLIGNAIKFTHEGQIVITVEPSSDITTGLHFTVHDPGIGIPPEKQSMIFEAFTQVDGSSTRRAGGTGLGLAIAARLVGLMGGRIWIESNATAGSTFHFTVKS
jgi:two-component system sensor histidine kinase/response regulator